MGSQPPVLFPLFRSKVQANLLAELFLSKDPRTITELAHRHGISRQSASRSLRALRSFGIVRDAVGATPGIEVNTDAPFYEALREIVVTTVGVPAVLAEELSKIQGVEQAYIFGSWAARARGEHGSAPNDLDVAVIGPGLHPGNTASAAEAVQSRVGQEVNFVTGTSEQWESADGFFAAIRQRPLLTLDIQSTPAREIRREVRDFTQDFTELLSELSENHH